jgi:hypothetical protein
MSLAPVAHYFGRLVGPPDRCRSLNSALAQENRTVREDLAMFLPPIWAGLLAEEAQNSPSHARMQQRYGPLRFRCNAFQPAVGRMQRHMCLAKQETRMKALNLWLINTPQA